jgi:propanol-preferring alcohol dehydrogenase
MQAMLLAEPGAPLVMTDMAIPRPGPCDVLVRVTACGVCRTDLHVLDGELPQAHYPLAQANEALADLRVGRFTGAAVITVAD